MVALSILICTLPDRAAKCADLVSFLHTHSHDRVEILTDASDRSVPTGQKRNILINRSEGKYFSFIDDDDQVPDYYINRMLTAIEQGPDVVTFNGWMTTDGVNRQDFTIKLGEKYEERNGIYYRFPNHLCAFRRDAIRGIQFPHIWQQEDYQWAKAIHDRKILKTEVHIEEPMYHYRFDSKKNQQKSNVKISRLR